MIKMYVKPLMLFLATLKHRYELQNVNEIELNKCKIDVKRGTNKVPTVLMQIWVDNEIAWLVIESGFQNTNQVDFIMLCLNIFGSEHVLYWKNISCWCCVA